MRLNRIALLVAATVGFSGVALAQSKEIKIGYVSDKTGPLELFTTQALNGLKMGLEYATGGKMEVAGKKIVLVEKDSQGKPDMGKALLAAAYKDDKVDIAVGPSSSAVALAMIPVAKENKKVLIIDNAAAEYLTGSKGNRYVFRAGRNSDHDGWASGTIFGRPGYFIATLAPDYAFGREGVASFREAMKGKPGQIVHEEYAPLGTTDFTAQAQRIFNALKDKPGRKIIWYVWAGPGNPLKVFDLNPQRYGIEVVTGGGTLYAYLPGAKALISDQSSGTHYFWSCPKNPVNDWLVKEHQKRYNAPPDFFVPTGMATGIAIVEALKKTNGNTDTETLIKALEGLTFDGPKGKVHFNKDNHQLMQPMYEYKFVADEKNGNGGVNVQCIREIPIDAMKFPVAKLKD